nr:MAG TPA: hypothetical protein [Caudoviricetes sp.]
MGEKGYKAFEKGMICKGKQYEENTAYEENGSEICEAGVMHYCENPFDVLNYYPLVDDKGDMTEFAEVEPLGKVYRKEDKCATNKLHIGAKIGSSGYGAKIVSEGKNSVIMAAGYQSQAKAKKGSWITLAEWVRTADQDEKGFFIWIPKCVKTEYVDGERIKEDTFYGLVDGEFKEVEEN